MYDDSFNIPFHVTQQRFNNLNNEVSEANRSSVPQT